MKTLIAALLLLMVVSPGESLVCKCGGYARKCPSQVEVCNVNETYCGNLRVNPEDPQLLFQGCMTPQECRGIYLPGWSDGCCSTDMCNSRERV